MSQIEYIVCLFIQLHHLINTMYMKTYYICSAHFSCYKNQQLTVFFSKLDMTAVKYTLFFKLFPFKKKNILIFAISNRDSICSLQK